jgi:cellulose synthase (UDP-forming)
MAMMYLVPILALTFDIRFADVTYPAFLAHSLPAVAVMILFAKMMRRDGFFRPVDAKVLAWEKILFVALQWPWVFWGVTMAIRDRLTGSFVDFRITPKGKAAEARLPMRIVAVYAALALGALIPVALADEVAEARGFYILSAINGTIYVILLLASFWHHLRSLPVGLAAGLRASWPQLSGLATVAVFAIAVGILRFEAGVQALAYGLEPTHLVKTEYVVAGAGAGQPGDIRIRFTLDWLKQRISEGGEP